jgi:hypothetical protein
MRFARKFDWNIVAKKVLNVVDNIVNSEWSDKPLEF